ncbi:RNA recognition motif domain containing protein [Babesia bovis T2Bo]|uniref:RNA binding protein, putative n=1 Tax=Babesia bovis TaxID=5865 RepID=A7AV01_BABBO|nr:RNA recognition motif domain containing protein [Babesia bovis T2Bo]EDO05627.1 RNA recognition motif domain containing protein [Babesia bovis T2Bo]|eukprot:XP_001609195.1 RNA binding protein [Babesia bovis T2Bo]
MKSLEKSGRKTVDNGSGSVEFSTESMLRDIKNVIDSFGVDVTEFGENNEDAIDLSSLPSDRLLIPEDILDDTEDAKPTSADSKRSKRPLDKGVVDDKKPLKKLSAAKLESQETSDTTSAVSSENAGPPTKKPRTSVRLVFTNVDSSEGDFKSLINNHASVCGKYDNCFMTARGKVVVIVANSEIANAYISRLNGYELNGKSISVSISSRLSTDDGKKSYMPSKNSYKSLALHNVPKQVAESDLAKSISDIPGASYKCLEKSDNGTWKVSFDTVQECIKFNSLINGTSLVFTLGDRTKKSRIRCEAPSFGVKTSRAGRVFVQNLPFNTSVKHLEALAHTFDKGATVHMPGGDKKKGFAFIQFTNANVANKAILRLNGSEFRGRNIRLTMALPTEIYADKPKTSEGDHPEDDIDPDNDEHEGSDTSNADLDAATEEGKSLNEDTVNLESNSSADQQQRTIFVRNLSYESTESGLREYFNTFGAVESCKICKDSSGGSRGTAFIMFKNVDDARKVLDLEELALERDAEFARSAETSRSRVKLSKAAGLGFSLNGRRLKLSSAISREEASTLKKREPAPKEEFSNKKHSELLMEGVILETSPEFQNLTPAQKKLQLDSWKEKVEKMKNPNMFVNPKRLCIRNLPNNVDVNNLRTAIASHFRKSVDLKKLYGTAKVDATRTIGKVTLLSDDKRKVTSGDTVMRRRKPFAFIDFDKEELALSALRYLSNNSELFGVKNCLFAEFAIEDSRALYVQRKRKEQYDSKLKEGKEAEPDKPSKAKKRKTYSRGQRQRMKRRESRAAQSSEADAISN